MSLTADQAKLELNKLIDNRKIKYLNNFVTLPNDSKSHYYNKGYELSKDLFKILSLYYIQDVSKRLNKKRLLLMIKHMLPLIRSLERLVIASNSKLIKYQAV